MKNNLIDHDLLQALVSVVDSGGFSKAANQLHLTQSAVSLQIRRLEEQTDQTMFEKQGRNMVLTDSGVVMLGYARKILALNREAQYALQGRRLDGLIRIGIPQDIAEDVLPEALHRYAQQFPRVQFEVKVDRNTKLIEAVQKNSYDIVVAQATEESLSSLDGLTNVRKLIRPKMRWLASAFFVKQHELQELPLVLLEAPCIFRGKALALLEQANIPYRIAYSTSSLSGLRSAVEAGLGITLRTGSSYDLDRHIETIQTVRLLNESLALPKAGGLQSFLYQNPGCDAPGFSTLSELLIEKIKAVNT